MILPRNFPRTILLCIFLASTILIQALAKDIQCIQLDDITFPTVSDCISAVEMMPLSSRIDHRGETSQLFKLSSSKTPTHADELCPGFSEPVAVRLVSKS
jgi:hypothetical protein